MVKRSVILIFLSLTSIIVSGSRHRNPEIIIKTEFGNIVVELYAKKAPVTTANFLRYADSSLFRNSSFYRVVRMDNQLRDSIRIEVIQGGRRDEKDKGFPPIRHETTTETGIRHLDGVISMARSVPGSATSEFFICVGDQPDLDFGGMRNKDGQGFAAFGRVKKGMDVVRRIHSLKTPGQYLEIPVRIFSIERNRN